MQYNKELKTRYGPWALVTGASSGIGKEFAAQLAAAGLNVIIAARNKPALDEHAATLKKNHGILVKTVQIDLAEPEAAKTLQQATDGIEVGLLVNNAGAENHGSFLGIDRDDETRIIQLNVMAPMQLAHIYGQEMSARSRGGIIFVSSMFGYQAVPYVANYAATKAYILALGESLNYELRPHGIDVTVLSPGLTDTAMPKKMEESGVDFSKTPMKMMGVGPVVETALKAFGKKSSVIPGKMNNIMDFMGKRIMTRAGNASMFGGIMKKALSKNLI
ncbi:MAG: SDR family NAD(P)-dependent oxidoreductase [bacterium]